jgi:hypothetical protein
MRDSLSGSPTAGGLPQGFAEGSVSQGGPLEPTGRANRAGLNQIRPGAAGPPPSPLGGGFSCMLDARARRMRARLRLCAGQPGRIVAVRIAFCRNSGGAAPGGRGKKNGARPLQPRAI